MCIRDSHKGGFLHYQAVDEALKEEADLKEEARVRGEDPEQYVLMRRLAQFGERKAVPNRLAEVRMMELGLVSDALLEPERIGDIAAADTAADTAATCDEDVPVCSAVAAG